MHVENSEVEVYPYSSNNCNKDCESSCLKETSFPISSCSDGERCIKLAHLYENSPAPIPVNTPESTHLDLLRKLFAEMLGTGLLLIVVVGSGIMAQNLSPNDVGIQLLENAISTFGGLTGLILMFGPVSGAHFNPVVSLIDYLNGDMDGFNLIMYTIVQIIGGILGTIIANVEFDKPWVEVSTKDRYQYNLWISEIIGTMTLLLIIHSCVRTGQKAMVPWAVGGWICGGYFFTSSTIFANPAVTIARMLTNTFAGIEPRSAGVFICFQLIGALLAYPLIKLFYPHNLAMKKDDNLYLRVCIQQNNKLNYELADEV